MVLCEGIVRTLITLSVGLLPAGGISARRTTNVDPMVALTSEYGRIPVFCGRPHLRSIDNRLRAAIMAAFDDDFMQLSSFLQYS